MAEQYKIFEATLHGQRSAIRSGMSGSIRIDLPEKQYLAVRMRRIG